MPLKIYKRDNQANGNFNSGEILEKKPIGFPQDGGILRPYSNLFYWAYAWAPNIDSTIGLHPHRGFEICSFVLKGEIEHYDTLLDRWITLKQGDVQVIRAGKGISHSEKLISGSEIFQIWFDPGLQESLYVDPSYDDFKSKFFSRYITSKFEVKTISNNKNQIGLKSKGIEIFEYTFIDGKHLHKIKKNSYHSIFILSGSFIIDDMEYLSGDFLIISNEKKIQIKTNNKCKFFEIISPVSLPYRTYAEIHKIN